MYRTLPAAAAAAGLYCDCSTYLGRSSPAMISFCVMRRSGELVCNGNNATAGTPIGVSSSLHCDPPHSVERAEVSQRIFFKFMSIKSFY